MNYIIKNATIINEGETKNGSLLIENDKITHIFFSTREENAYDYPPNTEIIDATGLWLVPGVIDDQVHFREPGLTHKGDIYSESRAAAVGGITSFMDMPNTIPQTTTLQLLEEKYNLAAQTSLTNYSFYFGATNQNHHLLPEIDSKNVCGVKVFMGSSTGNMLVDDTQALTNIFQHSPTLVAVHCEDEKTIRENKQHYIDTIGKSLDITYHPKIRSAKACFLSTQKAVSLAKKHQTRLHVLHLSTAMEMALFDETIPLREKRITAEACVHHLWFTDKDYDRLGNKIKWNPAVKTTEDRTALIDAINTNKIDVVATDHAPHTWAEKQGDCLEAMSGGPLVQHALIAMLQLTKQGHFTTEKVVEKMCHNPAQLFRIDRRGYIRENYYADLVLIDPNQSTTVQKDNIHYKCGWSPFEQETFDFKIVRTIVNGKTVFENGEIKETQCGRRLQFNS